jgi:hypothetical protein
MTARMDYIMSPATLLITKIHETYLLFIFKIFILIFRYLTNVEILNNYMLAKFCENLPYMKRNCGATAFYIHPIYTE